MAHKSLKEKQQIQQQEAAALNETRKRHRQEAAERGIRPLKEGQRMEMVTFWLNVDEHGRLQPTVDDDEASG